MASDFEDKLFRRDRIFVKLRDLLSPSAWHGLQERAKGYGEASFCSALPEEGNIGIDLFIESFSATDKGIMVF
jgi:hypothetical protein